MRRKVIHFPGWTERTVTVHLHRRVNFDPFLFNVRVGPLEPVSGSTGVFWWWVCVRLTSRWRPTPCSTSLIGRCAACTYITAHLLARLKSLRCHKLLDCLQRCSVSFLPCYCGHVGGGASSVYWRVCVWPYWTKRTNKSNFFGDVTVLFLDLLKLAC